MKLYTTPQISEIQQYTLNNDNVTLLQLIDRIAEGVTYEIESRWRPGKPLVIFAGNDLNGAISLGVARMLSEHKFNPEVYLFNIGGNALTPECEAYRDALLVLESDVYFNEIINVFSFPKLTSQHLVLDGLYGVEHKEPLKRGFVTLIQYINDSGATIVSIDVPTGMSGDANPFAVNRDIIHASLTIAIHAPHIAFFNPDNAELVGEWKIVDIGLNDSVIPDRDIKRYLIETEEIKLLLKHRLPHSSKADYGAGLLVAGSYGMMGAAILGARGALRAGVGKLTIEAPKCGFEVLQTAVPDATFQYNKGDFYITELNADKPYDAVAIGPGLGTNEATLQALTNFLLTRTSPVILDADALNCIAKRPTLLNSIPVLSIITPHVGEFDRLFGQHTNSEMRLQKALEVSRFYNFIIILKGRYTAIVRPDGAVCYNSSGTPAMATGGSGDVLTGVILGLLAQGYKPEDASIMGVFIHGIAGELAAREHGEYGVTASDIAANVGKAIMTIMKHKNLS